MAEHKTAADWNELEGFKIKDFTFIGINDIAKEGQFVYTSSGKPIVFYCWLPQSDSGGRYALGSLRQRDPARKGSKDQNCMAISPWRFECRDLICSKKCSSICQLIPPSKPTLLQLQ